MKESAIQWCDDTVSPVMGCDGCELWPTIDQITSSLIKHISEVSAISKAEIEARVESLIQNYESATELWHNRAALIQKLREWNPAMTAISLSMVMRKHYHCYAGQLHLRGARHSTSDAPVHKGNATVFEKPRKFRGRMAKVAQLSDLLHQQRPNKPWLNCLPRLVFVSDRGDALSRGIDFEYLKTEIINIVTSPQGRLHVWMWLTKRPERMAEFAEWLQWKYHLAWPENLVAMTSVTDRATCARIKHLQRVPAKLRGLSVEPLVESVDLNLTAIDWLIVGGESGVYAREFDIEWARSLREQCHTTGTAFFVKQLGAKPVEDGFPIKFRDSHGGDWDEWPDDLRIRKVPHAFRLLHSCLPIDILNHSTK